MVLKSSVEPMARALLEARGDAHQAVYALVKEANDASVYGDSRGDLLACASAIVAVNETRAEDVLADTPPVSSLDLDIDITEEFDYRDVPAA